MDFAIALDPNTAVPLHRQLYEALRGRLLAGRLSPGQRLPSSRELARSLGVSRNTVLHCYQQLQSEGYLQSEQGAGTFVSPSLGHGRPPVSPVPDWVLPLSEYGQSLSDDEPLEPLVLEAPINFCHGQLDLDRIPLAQWRRLWSRHCRPGHRAALDYAPDAQGYRPLREAVAGYLERMRAVRCDPNQILIVSGMMQAIDLAARILVQRGERVAIEEPTYVETRRVYWAQGAEVLPVPVDGSGLVVDRLPATDEAQIKLVHVTPSHQFPTGSVLALERRLALLEWAEKSGAVIFEDDCHSEFRYGVQPVPALQGLDHTGRVIYAGGFSGVLFPALRLGYLVLPRPLVRVFERAKWLCDRQSSLLEQHVMTDFISGGHLERHIQRMRSLYEQRRRVLVEALRGCFGPRVAIVGENAGLHLTIRLDVGLDNATIHKRAAGAGVSLADTRPCYFGEGLAGEFVLGFAGLSDAQICTGVQRLAAALGVDEPSSRFARISTF